MMHRNSPRMCTVCGLALFAASLLARSQLPAVEPPQSSPDFAPVSAVLARLSSSGEIELVELDSTVPLPMTTPRALLVWKPEVGRERWAILKSGGQWPDETAIESVLDSSVEVRGDALRGVGGLNTAGALTTTIQLEPLDGNSLIRGASFLSPIDGANVLSSRPTIRRVSEQGKFPKRTAILLRGNTDEVVLKVPFQEGQAQIELSKWTDWPATLKEGLPPGRYTLRFDNGLEQNRLTILDRKQVRRVNAMIDSMAEHVGDRQDPLVAQFAIEHLLSYRTDNNRPAYLGDALDVAESLPTDSLTPVLRRYRTSLREWAEKLANDPGYELGQVATSAPGTDTGIDSIDSARRLIAAGQWTDALQLLDQIEDQGDDATSQRVRGLQKLYRGVILAEAATGSADEAVLEFTQAIIALSETPDSNQRSQDLLRAQNNLANFHLLLAQNSLGNHAFQMAAGVDQPVLNCLQHLIQARLAYATAAKEAGRLKDPGSTQTIQINLARTSALLADVIRSLDVSGEEQHREFTEGELAATHEAVQLASSVTKLDAASVEPGTLSAGWELLAQLSYRQRDWKSADSHAQHARQLLIQSGDLAGVEMVERLLGLIALGRNDRADALKHFSIAQPLAELQRSRFPQDQTGQSRAGYFARHSFVYEKLVELHLADGRPETAFRFAEMVKARAAQDLLSTLGIAEHEEAVEPRDLTELLADWPADSVAVEYFLGTERSWGFVIREGKVRAFPLVNAQGQPIATRQLVADVRQFLSEMDHQAQKMLMHYRRTGGFDDSWQDRLLSFRNILLPDDVLTELRGSSHVIIVPQHILHYLPFSALVTERDALPHAKAEMVSPKFMVDEKFAITCTPSLTVWDLIRRRPLSPLDQVRVVGLVNAPGAEPLIGVEKDLNNLREVYGDKLKQVLEENAATEGAAKQLLSEPGVLMFATHGNNNAEHPTDSYLLLLQDEPSPNASAENSDALSVDVNDGRLTAKEIFARRVNARLIVMSACYTGLGDQSPQPGDDLFGLQRAFLYAGARTVLSGLWDVHDGVAPGLIRKFHERLLSGDVPSQALAESQRDFLTRERSGGKTNPLIHPYFWSVFCVAGAD